MPPDRKYRTELRVSQRSFLLALTVVGLAATPAAAQSLSGSSFGTSGSQLRGTTAKDTGTDKAKATNPFATPSVFPDTRPLASDATPTEPFVPSPDTDMATAQDPSPGDDPSTASVPDTGTETRVGSVDSIAASEDRLRDSDFGFGRQNMRMQTIDGVSVNGLARSDEVPGIRLGTLILRPTISEKIVHESVRDGGGSSSRLYSETEIGATLESDWSRHKLTVEGAGRLQNNLSGEGQEEPSASLEATLDLDLARDMIARLRAGYEFYKEDRTDPNAIVGAQAQAAVHSLSSSAALMKDFGILRGTATAEIDRTIFGDATLGNGTIVSGKDRDRLSGKFTGRIGYEISPALIPFLEASVERTAYDQKLDSNGFARSSSSYAIRLGAEVPYGEKLSGELAGGYVMRDIDDAALSDIEAFTVDGKISWSPRRGSVVNAGLATIVEAATAAGESGSVAYQLSLGLEQELRRTVVARLTGTALYRDFAGASIIPDETVLGARAELDWSVNRYLSLVADASLERSSQAGRPDSDSARVGLGLKLRR